MSLKLSKRQQLVLAAMAADRGASFAPVQVQKLFFLLDENLFGRIGGRQFAFEPYDYGPFDKAVYTELERLSGHNLVQISSHGPSAGARRYSLTPDGQEAGQRHLGKLPAFASEYMARVSSWVRSLSFAELVGSIYRAYPDMRKNSVFRG